MNNRKFLWGILYVAKIQNSRKVHLLTPYIDKIIVYNDIVSAAVSDGFIVFVKF